MSLQLQLHYRKPGPQFPDGAREKERHPATAAKCRQVCVLYRENVDKDKNEDKGSDVYAGEQGCDIHHSVENSHQNTTPALNLLLCCSPSTEHTGQNTHRTQARVHIHTHTHDACPYMLWANLIK